MNRVASIVVTLFVCLSASQVYADDACEKQVKSRGNFLTGKTWKVARLLKGVSKPDAFERIYAGLASDGWSISSSNEGAGVISATTQVAFSEGHVVPLNVIVQEKNAGSQITVSFAVGITQIAMSVPKTLCEIVDMASE